MRILMPSPIGSGDHPSPDFRDGRTIPGTDGRFPGRTDDFWEENTWKNKFLKEKTSNNFFLFFYLNVCFFIVFRTIVQLFQFVVHRTRPDTDRQTDQTYWLAFCIGILIIGANSYGGVYKLIKFNKGKLEEILQTIVCFFVIFWYQKSLKNQLKLVPKISHFCWLFILPILAPKMVQKSTKNRSKIGVCIRLRFLMDFSLKILLYIKAPN